MLIRKTKYQTTEFDLTQVQVDSTETYTAIPHSEIIRIVEEIATKKNINFVKKEFYGTKDLKIAEGVYTLDFGNDEFNLQFIWQNSTNKQVSFKAALGVSVMVCTNGSVWGDFGSIKRIHKGDADVDAYTWIEETLSNVKETFDKYVLLVEDMKNIVINRHEIYGICGELFFTDVISSDQINIIKKEMKESSFNYNVVTIEGMISLWEFWQHITHSFKVVSPRNYLPKQIEVSKFLNRLYFNDLTEF